MSNQMYTIIVRGERIAVSETVYRAYYQAYERERYLHLQSMRHELSWQRLEEAGVPIEQHLSQPTMADLENEALQEAMASLDVTMQEALWRLVMNETTERALAEEWGVSKTTVHKRKCQALATLRETLEKSGQ